LMQARTAPAPISNRLREQLGEGFDLSQQQIEKLSRVVTEVVGDLAVQMSQQAKVTAGVVRHVDRRVWWTSGIAVGFGVAGLTAYLVTRRRLRAQNETGELIEITEYIETDFTSAGDQLRDAANGTGPRSAATQSSDNGTATAAATARSLVAQGERLAAEAPFIGNLHTLVYHEAVSDNLPSEENRVYFFSEDEAREAGYRPVGGE
ncbi:MAG: hypothetical protein H0X24_21620, partial [Ktedonobacterales bacterium]|nr:hypothetical protein [Ktedonobacterales bacterium]